MKLIACIFLLAFAVPAQAGQTESLGDTGRLFDGSGGAAVALPEIRFTPSRPPAAGPAAHGRTKQSGSDLFYFTPEEAAEGAERSGLEAVSDGRSGLFDADVPADVQTQLRADLAFIAGIQGREATPLHSRIFGAVSGDAYSSFFASRVKAIGMDDCGHSIAVACVKPYWNSSKLWLTQNYIRFSHPQVSRMMVVYHEARHTETAHGNWHHAVCPAPFKDADGKDVRSIWTGASLAGEPACDSTPLGSYGSSTIMLKNIQLKCTSCTEKVRMDAGLYADDQLGRVTDAEARRRIEEDFKE
ncbi:MAG: hypothetical protein HY928_16135 [Elusimicrobia bacterium]|nr:hypothetical protein [Elusimicrobiota bacterium]